VGIAVMPDSSTSLVVTRDRQSDELAAVVHQAARAAFGATALITEVVLRTLSESAATRSGQHSEVSLPASEAVDVVLGIGWGLAHVADRMVGLASRIAYPAISVVLDPPLLPQGLHPAALLRRAALGWRSARPDAVRSLYAWSATITPAANDLALNLVDADELVTRALADLDLTPVVESVVRQLDLEEIVGLALDQLDLTDMVVDRVDLHRVVTSVLEDLDLTELILERVDLVKVADVVVDGVDLPEIIRESSASMASETVHDVRLQSIEADRAVAKFVDRLLRRRAEPL
jgi:hypothetical protein